MPPQHRDTKTTPDTQWAHALNLTAARIHRDRASDDPRRHRQAAPNDAHLETRGHLQRDPCRHSRPHGCLQQNGGSEAQHASDHVWIRENLHIWGFVDEKMNTHPSFPHPSLGGWEPRPQHFVGGKRRCLCLLYLSWSSWRKARDPKFVLREQKNKDQADRKDQAPSRLNMEGSSQTFTTRGISPAGTAVCPPPAHTRNDCLTLPSAHIGPPHRHPIPIVGPGDTIRVQTQKRLWSHADIPKPSSGPTPNPRLFAPLTFGHSCTHTFLHTPEQDLRAQPQSEPG